jgi:hypothetical protein
MTRVELLAALEDEVRRPIPAATEASVAYPGGRAARPGEGTTGAEPEAEQGDGRAETFTSAGEGTAGITDR